MAPGLDVDPEALDLARDRLAAFGRRVVLVNASYGSLAEIASDQASRTSMVCCSTSASLRCSWTPLPGFSFRPTVHSTCVSDATGDRPDLLTDIEEEELVRALRDFG
jgi:16S rRNA C1402 N4-methylase RsmH